MTNQIRMGCAAIAFAFGTTACAGQGIPNWQPPAPKDNQVARENHQCPGSVCGPKTLMTEWTLESSPNALGELSSSETSECLSTVCGPMTTPSPTWVLPNSTQECLATICGPMTMAASSKSDHPQLAHQIQSGSQLR